MNKTIVGMGATSLVWWHLSAIKSYRELHLYHKLAVWMRIASLIVLAVGFALGKPPSIAQIQPVQPVITSEDAVQDERISDLKANEINQNNWNKETGQQINTLKDDLSSLTGEVRGIFAALTLLNGIGMFFQLKRRQESSPLSITNRRRTRR